MWQLYDDDPTKSGSRLCGCNAGPELKCTWLEEIEKKPCNTESAFYRWANTTHLPTFLHSIVVRPCYCVRDSGWWWVWQLVIVCRWHFFSDRSHPCPVCLGPHQSPHMAATDTMIVLLQFKIHLWSDKEL